MSKYPSYLAIGIGLNNHYYTLREVWYDDWNVEPQWRGNHIMNLSQNVDEAIEKAKYQSKLMAMELRASKEELEQEMFKIHRANAEELERREQEKEAKRLQREEQQAEYVRGMIRKIDADMMPFGQYADQYFEDVPFSYIQWILKSQYDDDVWYYLRHYLNLRHPEFILPVADPVAVIGNAGDKVELDVVVVKRAYFDGQWGRVYIVSMVSNKGVMLVSKGAFCADVGRRIKIKGSIKGHAEYNGQMQSIIQRVKIVEPKQK